MKLDVFRPRVIFSKLFLNSTVLDLSFADVQGSQLVALFVVVEAGEFIAP